MSVSRQKNAAFTLVELLVVITVLGILMGLLVPAVSMVRESMRRTQCKNNLGQIGKAAQSHLTQYGFLPSAGWGRKWLGDADKGTGGPQPGGWIYQLLPFMGLDLIHDKGKLQGSGTDTSSYKYTTAGPEMRAAAVAIFICPTRRKGTSYPDSAYEGAFNSAPSAMLNKTDYAANGGTLVPQVPFDGPPISCYSAYPNPTYCTWDPIASTGDGVIYQASQMTPGNITDGLGNTFLAGEKSLVPDNYTNGADPGDNNSMLHGYDQDTVRWCSQGLLPVHDTPGVLNTTNQFGSPHMTGANFAYCDGSVRIISYQIDALTYRNLGCRNDGVINESY